METVCSAVNCKLACCCITRCGHGKESVVFVLCSTAIKCSVLCCSYWTLCAQWTISVSDGKVKLKDSCVGCNFSNWAYLSCHFISNCTLHNSARCNWCWIRTTCNYTSLSYCTACCCK